MTDRTRVWLTRAGVAAVALSGWGVALFAWGVDTAEDVTLGGSAPGAGTRLPHPLKERPAAQEAVEAVHVFVDSTFEDPQSRDILKQLETVAAAAVPGQVNQAYVDLVGSALTDNDFERRTRNFAIIMAKLRPEDAQAVHEEFSRLHGEGLPFGHEYAHFAGRWGEVDGAAALAWITEDDEGNTWDLGHMLRGWAQADPAAAARFYDGLIDTPRGHLLEHAHNSVACGWARTDPAGATAWIVARVTGAEDGGEAARASAAFSEVLLQVLYGQGVDGASRWLASMPEDPALGEASRQAWDRIVRHQLDNINPDVAARTWSEIGDLGWVGIDQFSRIYDRLGAASTKQADGFYHALVAAGWDDEKIGGQFERWAVEQPEATSRWLADTPRDSAVRPAAIAGMIRALDRIDPNAAEAWREELARAD